ncbi:LysR family transcriptional regulator [soil metagenome]
MKNMKNLKGVESFITAANLGSFSKAAGALEISPQAVSANVARLEEFIGTRLFNRTTRSLILTEEGAAFLIEAKLALERLDAAVENITSSRQQPAGLVRVSSGINFGRRFLLPLLPKFSEKFPKIRLEICFDDRKVDLIREGFDLAVRGGVIGDSSLITRKLCALTSVLVASPDYLARAGVPAHPRELEQHRLIQMRFLSGQTSSWEFKVGREHVVIEPKGDLALSDAESVCEMAVLGMGIAQVGLFHAIRALREGKLKLLLLDYHIAGNRQMVLQYPHREHLAPRVRAFAEYVLAALSRHPDLQLTGLALSKFAAVESIGRRAKAVRNPGGKSIKK